MLSNEQRTSQGSVGDELRAVDQFLNRIRTLEPDFTSARSCVPTDREICRAPRWVGQLYAQRFSLELESRQGGNSEQGRRARAAVSFINTVISMELQQIADEYGTHDTLKVCSNGMVVIPHQMHARTVRTSDKKRTA